MDDEFIELQQGFKVTCNFCGKHVIYEELHDKCPYCGGTNTDTSNVMYYSEPIYRLVRRKS